MNLLKVALVMPTHFDINSSLNNFIKTYEYLIKNKNIEVTLFTDVKNDISLPNFKIKKIKGLDYNTFISKILFALGIPRFYYPNLINELKNFDVITANNPEFYIYSYQAYKAAKKYKTRFVLRTSQTKEGFFLYKLLKLIINPLVKKAYSFSKFCIFTNPQAEQRCLKLGLLNNKNKSIVTGHATDIECFKPIKTKPNNKTILLSVGGLIELKGHQLIIQAFKKILKKGHDAELWIVGKGHYKQTLIYLTNKLNLINNVKFIGAKGHNELTQLYNSADIFVLANFQEITPAVNEALACEKPVVVMECGGRKFVIPDESYGLVAKKYNTDDLANKIITLINNKTLAKSIAKKGRKRVIDNFSIKIVAEKIYSSFVDQR